MNELSVKRETNAYKPYYRQYYSNSYKKFLIAFVCILSYLIFIKKKNILYDITCITVIIVIICLTFCDIKNYKEDK